MKLVFFLVLLILAKTILLYRVNHRLPLRELKRRARAGDHQAAAIYKVAANGRSLDVLIYMIGFAADAFLVIAAARYAWWLAVALILFVAWLVIWAPQPRVGGLSWRLTAWTSPLIFKILTWLHPGLDFIARLVPSRTMPHLHAGLYETEDLVELIQNQADQLDSRIPKEDLQMAAGALTFGSKSVAKTMTPRRKVRFVSEGDVLGPLLLDELHKTGLSRFPVVKGSAKSNMPEITGTLYLKDIIEVGQEDKGTVKQHMKKGAYFIDETCDLRQALEAILANQHHQLVVVNNFEEMVGVLTLEDILEQVIGRPIVDEFDRYDDLRAVASIEAEREKEGHEEVTPPEDESEPTVAKTTIASDGE